MSSVSGAWLYGNEPCLPRVAEVASCGNLWPRSDPRQRGFWSCFPRDVPLGLFAMAGARGPFRGDGYQQAFMWEVGPRTRANNNGVRFRRFMRD